MKKIFFLLLPFSITHLFAQNPYYDAIKLKNIGYTLIKNRVSFFKEDSLKLDSILHKYVPNAKTYAEMQALFATNPFIKVPETNSQSSGGTFNLSNATSLINAGASSLSGMDVTNFADGLAKFLVKRAKEELSLAFFQKFKDDLNDSRYGDLKILFPQTWKTLMSIDKDIYQYSIYLNTLRAAFVKDMTNEFVNLQKLLKQQKYMDYFHNNPELSAVLNSSLFIINEISSGKHPGQVLADYKPGNYIHNLKDKALDTNLISSIKTMQLISSSFRSRSKTNYWVPADSVFMLLDDSIAFKIYLGLIYQNAKNKKIAFAISENNFLSMVNILDSTAKYIDTVYTYKCYIRTFVNNAEEINQYVADLKTKKKSEIDYNDYYKLFSASIDLFEHATQFIDLPYVKLDVKTEESIRKNSANWIYVTRTGADLYIDVRTKNYSSAILNTVNIIDTLLNYQKVFYIDVIKTNFKDAKIDLDIAMKKDGEFKKEKKKYLNTLIEKYSDNKIYNYDEFTKNELVKNDFIKRAKANGITNVDIITAAANVIKKSLELAETKNKDKVRNYIAKYGTFIATVAQAQNSDEVQAAIESIAMPAGSYSVKRNSSFNIAVQAYVGATYDWANPAGMRPEMRMMRDNNNLNWSMAAPVGLNFSFGRILWRSSLSLFVSVIDVGGLANLRLNNDTVALTRKITLADIFSPGASIVYGIPKLPISLSTGIVYKPTLMYDNNHSNLISIPGMFRWNISLLVDIPVINLFNRSEKFCE